MKKRLFTVLTAAIMLTALMQTPAFARPAYGGELSYTDELGGKAVVVSHGDEFFSYTTTPDGRLVSLDDSGALRFVVQDISGSYKLGALVSGAANGAAGNADLSAAAFVTKPDKQKLEALRSSLRQEAESEVDGLDGVPLLMAANGGGGFDEIPENYDYKNDPLYGLLEYGNLPQQSEHGSTIPAVVLLLEFSGNTDPEKELAPKCLCSDYEWNQLLFGDTGSVAAFYTENSAGTFTYVPASESYEENDGVIRVTLPIDRPLYTGNDVQCGLYHGYGDGYDYAIYNTSYLFAHALRLADAYIDFADYDANDDGFVTSKELALIMAVAGNEAAFGADDMFQGRPAVYAHSWSINTHYDEHNGYLQLIKLDGVKLGKYTTVGENNNINYRYNNSTPDEQNIQSDAGGLCHELGHDLGLPDLYSTVDKNMKYEVKGLSVMSTGCYGRASSSDPIGSSPTHFDAFSKQWLGFCTPTDLTGPGDYTLTQASSPEYNIYKIQPLNSNVYYLVENRTATGFDAGLAAFGYGKPYGLVYWRVDPDIFNYYWSRGLNEVNSHEGEYGVIPEFIEYSEYGEIEQFPFRNSATSEIELNFSVDHAAFDTLRALCEGGAASAVLNCLKLNVPPNAPRGITAGAADAGKSNGRLIGTTSAMEYSKTADFASAFACGEGETTGLPAGTYYIRYKAAGSVPASACAAVIISTAAQGGNAPSENASAPAIDLSGMTQVKNGVNQFAKQLAEHNAEMPKSAFYQNGSSAIVNLDKLKSGLALGPGLDYSMLANSGINELTLRKKNVAVTLDAALLAKLQPETIDVITGGAADAPASDFGFVIEDEDFSAYIIGASSANSILIPVLTANSYSIEINGKTTLISPILVNGRKMLRLTGFAGPGVFKITRAD